MLKKLIILVSAGLVLSACGHDKTPIETPPVTNAETEKGAGVNSNSIDMKDFKFNPASLTVKAGETITITNKDLAGHSYTSDDGSFDTGVLSQGQSKEITAPMKPGTYLVHCVPHPSIVGTVVVTE